MVKFFKADKSQMMPESVAKHLIAQGLDAGWVGHLKAVCKSRNGEMAFDVRIFDEAEAGAKGVRVKDYTSLDAYPQLVLYEGWFDTESMKVELTEKATAEVKNDDSILSHSEIWKRIARLTKPGSTVFFYLGSAPSSGGPFSRGAVVIELNPDYPGKKQRKYNISTVDVEGMQLKGKSQKLWDSDETKKIADWVKERHYKPAAAQT